MMSYLVDKYHSCFESFAQSSWGFIQKSSNPRPVHRGSQIESH